MYEIIAWIYHHRNDPLTVTTVVAFILLVLDKLGRNLINHQLKRLFHIKDKSQFAEYARNQQRIEAKLDHIAKHMGVEEWNLPQRSLSPAKTQRTRSYFSFLQAAVRLASQLKRRKKIMQKLKSRKLWVAIITAVLVALNDQLGWGFNQESIVSFVTLAVGYILGQAHVDSKQALKGAASNGNYPADHGPTV